MQAVLECIPCLIPDKNKYRLEDEPNNEDRQKEEKMTASDNDDDDDDDDPPQEAAPDPNVRKSLSLLLIRHAESHNNQVYRDARQQFGNGTPDFDAEGCREYVETHRSADPALSDTGRQQAQHLAMYLVPHFVNQASHPVRIITSPMKRTLLTIQPTLERLQKEVKEKQPASASSTNQKPCRVKVVGFYHETGGCYDKGKPVEGMNQKELTEMLKDSVSDPKQDIDFVGFPKSDRGWYIHGSYPETRAASEARADKFLLWLTEYLDAELQTLDGQDLFDAGASIPGEEDECPHDKVAPRLRRRRTALLVGHADFMSLVLTRMVAGFGHAMEQEGYPHRSALVHFNTGITELEYFGKGRFLVMCSNHTPHFKPEEHATLRTGGSMKDGWSYVVPPDRILADTPQVVAKYLEEPLDHHVRQQMDALQSLYLATVTTQQQPQQLTDDSEQQQQAKGRHVRFILQRGLQVVGVATYAPQGLLYGVALRPSSQKDAAKVLMKSVKRHAKKIGRSTTTVRLKSNNTIGVALFRELGWEEKKTKNNNDKDKNDNAGVYEMEYVVKLTVNV